MNPLWLWVLTLIVVFAGVFGTANAIRYYKYQYQLKTTGGPTGTEVYWVNPTYFDTMTSAYTAPKPLALGSTSPTNGSGYYAYATAYNTGMLATWTDLSDALGRGMTVDHWGFFDGECGDSSPGDANVRGRLCAINCCSPTTSCSPPSATMGKNKQNCNSPSIAPPSSSGICCSGNVASSSTGQCSPCHKVDANIDIKFGSGASTSKFSLATCNAWYPEKDGLFVACPQQHPSPSMTIPKIPGGPWDASGNTIESHGPSQPSVSSKSNVNAYQLNQENTIDFGKSSAPFNKLSGTTAWVFRMGFETASPSSSSDLKTNPWAGAFVIGPKPPLGTLGVLPFDITGKTANSNNGWNDPNAIETAPPAPAFQWIPDSQIIFGLIVAAVIAFIFGVMWFRSTRLGEALLYWV